MKVTGLNELMDGRKVLKGDWEIGPNHEIRYRKKGNKEEYWLKGTLLKFEDNQLLFTAVQKQDNQTSLQRIHSLKGIWALDPRNRVFFFVQRQKGAHDILTFKGSWKVGKNNEFIYTYKETQLKTKQKIEKNIVFKGYWDVDDFHRLTYFLKRESNSAFRIRGAFQTHSILAKKGELRYQAGVEASGKHRIQTITLFGKWKMSRDLALSFEMEYKEGTRSIAFGARYSLDALRNIHVNLRSRTGKPLGVEVIFTRDFKPGTGQAFLKLMKSLDESKIEVGARIPW